MDEMKLWIVVACITALLLFSVALLIVFWRDRNFAFAMTFMQIALVIVASTWGPHLVLSAELLIADVHAALNSGSGGGEAYWPSLGGLVICSGFGLASMKIRHAEFRIRAMLEYSSKPSPWTTRVELP